MKMNFDKVIVGVRSDIPKNSIVRKTGKHFFRGHSKKLYVVTPYWHATLRSLPMRYLRRRILKAGHSCLVYQFPFKVLSDNVHLTEKYFKDIQREVKRDITAVQRKHGFSKIVVLGMSLGCVNAVMVANKNPKVTTLILVVPGNSLAESLWRGIGTTKLKQQIKKHGINLEKLEKDWKDLAPENNIGGLTGKNIEIYVSKSDRSYPIATAMTSSKI